MVCRGEEPAVPALAISIQLWAISVNSWRDLFHDSLVSRTQQGVLSPILPEKMECHVFFPCNAVHSLSPDF